MKRMEGWLQRVEIVVVVGAGVLIAVAYIVSRFD